MTLDPQEGIASARDAFERRAARLPLGRVLVATFDGMLRAIRRGADVAAEIFSHALEIQQRLGDWEGGGMSLGGLASLAAARGDVSGGA